MRKHLTILFGLLALVAAGCGGGEETPAPAPSADTAAPPAAAGGKVAGVVHYANGDPDTAIKMDADPVCAGLHGEPVYTETLVSDGAGHLANAFVYVKEGLQGNFRAPSEPLVFDQNGCQYRPHVTGVMTGQKLIIRNSDPTLHNIHALPTKNPEFNQGQPFQGMELEKAFEMPEVMVRFKCDVHPWMSAYMAVLPHPFFAVSGADGSFTIDGLPPGSYVLEAWHETLGTRTQNVTVESGGMAQVAFDFAPAA